METVECLIDWVACTFHRASSQEEVMRLFAPVEEWEERGFGSRGYRRSAKWGHVILSWEGSAGYHLEIPGEGVRELETLAGWNWREKFKAWAVAGAKFSRLDVAFDERCGLLDLAVIESNLAMGNLVTRAKGWTRIQKGVFGEDCGQQGWTIGIGSRSSDTYVRFYDKARERNVEGHWLRCEVEWKGERAEGVVGLFVDRGECVFAKLLRAHLQFKVAHEKTRIERARCADWWDRFLGTVEALRLSLKGVKRTIDQVASWFEHSISPVFAALVTYWGGDMSKVSALVEKGAERWKTRHFELLGVCKAQAS